MFDDAVFEQPDQLDLARDDLDSATALVTARPLAGDDVYRGSDKVGQVIYAGLDYFFYALGP